MEARIMGSRNLMQQKKTIKRTSLKNANDMKNDYSIYFSSFFCRYF